MTERLAGKRPITARPAAPEARSQVGHWEADTMLGAGQAGPSVPTLVERTTGYLLIGCGPSGAGTFRLHSGQDFLSQALNHEYVGFEVIADGLWNILYYDTLLGRFDEETHTITGAPSLKKKC